MPSYFTTIVVLEGSTTIGGIGRFPRTNYYNPQGCGVGAED